MPTGVAKANKPTPTAIFLIVFHLSIWVGIWELIALLFSTRRPILAVASAPLMTRNPRALKPTFQDKLKKKSFAMKCFCLRISALRIPPCTVSLAVDGHIYVWGTVRGPSKILAGAGCMRSASLRIGISSQKILPPLLSRVNESGFKKNNKVSENWKNWLWRSRSTQVPLSMKVSRSRPVWPVAALT